MTMTQMQSLSSRIEFDNQGADIDIELENFNDAPHEWKGQARHNDYIAINTTNRSHIPNKYSRALHKKLCVVLITAVICGLSAALCILSYWLYLSPHLVSQCSSNSTNQGNYSQFNSDACSDPPCTLLAAELLTSMNLSADPCDDFYVYACGMFGSSVDDTFNRNLATASKQNNMSYRRRLERLLNSPVDKFRGDSSTVEKAKQFYISCTSHEGSDKDGRINIRKLIADLNFWPLSASPDTGVWDLNTWNPEDALLRAHRMLFNPLFTIRVIPDLTDSSKNILSFQKPSLTLNNPRYYLRNGASEWYKEYVENVLTFIYGGKELLTPQKITDWVEKLWTFEHSLSRISTIPTNLHIISYNSFSKRIPFLNVTSFANKLMSDNDGIAVTNETTIFVDEEYFISLNNLISAMDEKDEKETLAAYIVWSSVHAMLPYAGDTLAAARIRLDSLLNGKNTEKIMETDCAKETLKRFQYLDTWDRVRKPAPQEVVKKVEALIQEFRDEFIEHIAEIPWIEKETKKKATEKLKALKWEVGTSDEWPFPLLKVYYHNLSVSDDFFRNILQSRWFLHTKRRQMLQNPYKMKQWQILPIGWNGFYKPTSNKIEIPETTLQMPVIYIRNSLRPLFYGTIGTIIGHEVVHGFDLEGREYDGRGYRVNWWDAKSDKEYSNRSQCFVEQYNRESQYKKHPIGQLTINENIADNGGIRLAYMILKNYINSQKSKEGTEEDINLGLSGLNLSGMQQFFLGYAQLWCSEKETDGEDEEFGDDFALFADSHAPVRLRVNAVLHNLEEFSKTFDCPASSPMNPPNRCVLW